MREIVGHEHRNHQIRLPRRNQRAELSIPKGKGAKDQSANTVAERDGKPKESVEDEHPPQGCFVAGRKRPLSLRLVGSVVGDIEEEASNQHRPESKLAAIEPEVRKVHDLKTIPV